MVSENHQLLLIILLFRLFRWFISGDDSIYCSGLCSSLLSLFLLSLEEQREKEENQPKTGQFSMKISNILNLFLTFLLLQTEEQVCRMTAMDKEKFTALIEAAANSPDRGGSPGTGAKIQPDPVYDVI